MLRLQREPRESCWRSIEAGAEAHGPVKRLRLGKPRETGIEARVTGAEVERPLEELQSLEEDQICEVDQEEWTDLCAIRECLLPRLECLTPRSEVGYCCSLGGEHHPL
jgi:hypothetical protein